ncbi:MAG: ATP-binding protein, partial [Candidatus Marinimicrobia bacterium]|nr:ATP-binding protein [Candidatus Neomarinimicrobiota bacterium]MBT4416443.1 ATP-binding protein [Flavobacteriaceae bacterium]MBT5772255.1 ATP-binding protein [Flavobacteriaceae bacterium]
VLFGPESSGKTTLSRELASYYNTHWVEEYAREYLQNKWDQEKKICELEDIIPISNGQIKLENEFSKKTKNLLICDTDLLETKVYSETYYNGFCDPILEKYAIENKYDLYILTDIDISWVKDDLRDRPNNREEMFNAFKQALITHNKPYILVSGNLNNRMKIATKEIDKLLNK